MENLLNNPWTVTVIGGVIVLIIGYYGLGIGKREKGNDHSKNKNSSSVLTAVGNISVGRDMIIGEAHVPEESQVTKLSLPQHKKRRVVDVTPDQLIKPFKDNMSIHAQKLVSSYIGKWMKISGHVGNIGAFNGTFSQVIFSDRTVFDGQVYMLFRNQEYVEDRLLVLNRGAKITVLGQIDRIDGDLQLDNCELI